MDEKLTDFPVGLNAFAQDARPQAPRPAPLDVPRQVLERPARPSVFDALARMLMRNA